MLAGLLALCSGIDAVTLPVRLSASERLRQAGGGSGSVSCAQAAPDSFLPKPISHPVRAGACARIMGCNSSN
jgi:hypothetical protein